MEELDSADDVAFIRGFEGTPEGFWILPQIVHWIAFGDETATDPNITDQVLKAEAMLRQACAEASFALLGTQADHQAASVIPATVYADPVWFSLSHNSIEPDDEMAPPTFVKSFQPWIRIRALEKAVRERWPHPTACYAVVTIADTPLLPNVSAETWASAKEPGFALADRDHFAEIGQRRKSGQASSAYGAALQLAREGKLAGAGTPESRAKRVSALYKREIENQSI